MVPSEQALVSATQSAAGVWFVSQHPVPVHMLPAQQAPPAAPHGGVHTLLMHVSPLAHFAAFATQVLFVSQQPPAAHAVPPPVQHAFPEPPQFWHVPAMHVPLVHAPFTPMQMLPPAVSQHPPPLHVFPAQHPAPPTPHAPQMPLLHTELFCEHAAPLA
jgi:hypothetical protein